MTKKKPLESSNLLQSSHIKVWSALRQVFRDGQQLSIPHFRNLRLSPNLQCLLFMSPTEIIVNSTLNV